MNEKVKYAVEKLQNAFSRLKEGADSAKDDLEKDGVIQRFEFTFELLWKALKIYLEFKGIQTKTPRDSLQEAFRIQLIDNEDTFLSMLEDRNKTSHIYDQQTSEEIFIRIKDEYLSAIEILIKKLKVV